MQIATLRRFGLLVLLFIGFFVVVGGQGAIEDSGSGVRLAILTPPNGFITLNPLVEVKGTAFAEAPEIKIDVVVVSVNGEAKKAELKADGSFQATVELAYGENIISAVAVASNNEIGSDKVSVILQREVLFFDDFEDGPDPTWGAASGTWIGTDEGGHTIQEHGWEGEACTYMVEGASWRDYAIEVDVTGVNKEGWSSTGVWRSQYVGVIIRALDDQNKILLINEYRNWLCWHVYRKGQVEACVGGKIQPGLPDRAHIRLEAVGDTIAAYVNGVKRTTLKLKGEDVELFSQGMPGLYIQYNFGEVDPWSWTDFGLWLGRW
ncbi:MAG: hypothetical protein NUW06_07230, partial [Candidatus Acetothermia bacterium]|nr:hypothetical protein [Candidatus Acetothermia bacterium]